jgi:hypothetical protein
MVVETIFQYRTLLGKCELGCGLDWDEIETLTQIEHAFAPGDTHTMRRHRREKVELEGFVRGDQLNDPIAIVEIGPGGMVCRKAPFIARGEQIEIVLDVGDRTYRFTARGVWMIEDGDDYKIGVAFVGMPVCLHKVALSRHERDVIDHISAAA